jgi:hypothetical protein
LEDWLTTAKTWVREGDQIGTVGNSGNARSTPPHLHFAVSIPGYSFVDPYPYVRKGDPKVDPIAVDTDMLGKWIRARADITAPEKVGGKILRHTPMRVLGAAEDRYRVLLPGGSVGWISAHDLEPASAPLSQVTLDAAVGLLDSPQPHAVRRAHLTVGETVEILGFWEDLWFVRSSMNHLGWITTPSHA